MHWEDMSRIPIPDLKRLDNCGDQCGMKKESPSPECSWDFKRSHNSFWRDIFLPNFHLAFSSVEFSHSVMSDSTISWIAARQASLSTTPGVYSNSCPSNRWCHPAISSSVIPFSCPQSLPTSGAFQMSQLFAWGGQSIGVSASASVLPMNTQDGSPLGWTVWIYLQSKGLSRVFSNTTVQKPQFFSTQLSSQSNSHIHNMTTGKTIALTRQTFVSKVMSLFFNMLCRLVITFLPKSKRLLISQLQSPSAVILEPKNKVWHCFHCFPIYFPWGDGTRCHNLSFLNVKL